MRRPALFDKKDRPVDWLAPFYTILAQRTIECEFHWAGRLKIDAICQVPEKRSEQFAKECRLTLGN
jgi:hypothetical protein